MTYVAAPTEYLPDGRPSLFLAGGITGCGDWQWDFARRLEPTELVVFNPRRRHFPMDDPDAGGEQIRWEFRHLRRAAARLFWFPPATLCPIALYELGAWSIAPGPLFVGVDPDYARRFDVESQTGLVRPDVRVAHSLDELAGQVLEWARVARPAAARAAHPGQQTKDNLPLPLWERAGVRGERMELSCETTPVYSDASRSTNPLPQGEREQ